MKYNSFLPYEEARVVSLVDINKFAINNKRKWFSHCLSSNRHKKVPVNPETTYKGKGWISWNHWLGKPNKLFLSFQDAFNVTRPDITKFNIHNINAWKDYSKNHKSKDIPACPNRVYKNKGWISWSHWLGGLDVIGKKCEFKKHIAWLSFEDARERVREDSKIYNLDCTKKWYWYCNTKKPVDIPASPWKTYKNKGWAGFCDWFGYKRVHYSRKRFLPFEQAIEVVRKDAIKYELTQNKWGLYSKDHRPLNIPSNPHITYKDSGWVSWNNWLGINEGFKNFNDAFKDIEKDLKKYEISTGGQWRKKYVETKIKPTNIPSCPDVVYRGNGWISWNHWLRTDRVEKNKSILGKYSELVDKYWDWNSNTKSPDQISFGEQSIINLICDKNHKWQLSAYSLRKIKGCPYCMHKRIIREESFGYCYPNLLKYWDYKKNIIDPYKVYAGAGKKVHLKCYQGHEWQRKIEHIVNRGDNCPYCTHSKIKLKDGTVCNSMIEAYYCLLLKQSETKFDLNLCYPKLSLRYDFYIPSLNLYIEVTSYNDSVKWWDDYLLKIKRKKDHVENNLGSTFEFINRQLSTLETRFVMENIAQGVKDGI